MRHRASWEWRESNSRFDQILHASRPICWLVTPDHCQTLERLVSHAFNAFALASFGCQRYHSFIDSHAFCLISKDCFTPFLNSVAGLLLSPFLKPPGLPFFLLIACASWRRSFHIPSSHSLFFERPSSRAFLIIVRWLTPIHPANSSLSVVAKC